MTDILRRNEDAANAQLGKLIQLVNREDNAARDQDRRNSAMVILDDSTDGGPKSLGVLSVTRSRRGAANNDGIRMLR